MSARVAGLQNPTLPALQRWLWKWLVLAHRWLAIGTCLLFTAWFISGLVMMYVGFPALSTKERVAGLGRIEWDGIRITPDRAMRLAQVAEFPRELRLEMMAGEPVYRMRLQEAPAMSVSAEDGRIIRHITAAQAQDIAVRFVRSMQPALVRAVTRDQWTVSGAFDRHRPLYRVQFDDDAGTALYVSSRSGEVVLDTTARERRWNWIGAVTHWLYFRDLRQHAPLWRQVVLWLSGIGILVAASGIWLGIDRLRLRRRYRGSAVTPYRGWAAWHHVAGVIGGIFLATWIFSGWLSMDPPLPWAGNSDARRAAAGLAAYQGHTRPDFDTSLQALHGLAGRDVREASFRWVDGRPLIALTGRSQRATLVDGRDAAIVVLREAALRGAARKLIAGAGLIDMQLLSQPEAYWYSHRTERTLPALRFKFDDPDRTWIYIDPGTGAVLGRVNADDRLYRWLFNALHSLDFRWLLAHRPAWDVVMWLLSLAGLMISITGVVMGWRRLSL